MREGKEIVETKGKRREGGGGERREGGEGERREEGEGERDIRLMLQDRVSIKEASW